MDAESRCFSFTKALCLEVLRFTVAGWPFGCLREAFRDGGGYFAGDLVLLNEPAVFHNPDIWFDTPSRVLFGGEQHAFIPTERRSTSVTNLPHCMILNSKVCFLPRAFLFHVLLASTVHLFSRCSFKDPQEEEGMGFSNLPLLLPLDFSAMCDAVLKQKVDAPRR